MFVTAVTGNYASYVSHNRAQGKTGSETQAWYYDIDKVSNRGCCAAPWYEPDPNARHEPLVTPAGAQQCLNVLGLVTCGCFLGSAAEKFGRLCLNLEVN